MNYRKEIDGLRAVAVLAVLFFHFGEDLRGGFAGVDVFFVISGFLIGSIALKDIRANRFSLAGFWIRRIRRLFPALFFVVIAVAVASYFWMVPKHLEEIGKSILAQPGLVANIYFFQESGYFETASEYQPLLHTWSLAVEEQFYLFFPLLFPWLVKRGRAVALKVTSVIAILSLAWSIYGSISYQSFSFYLIPSRAWELALGLWLALVYETRPRPVGPRGLREVLSIAGIGMIVGSFFLIDKHTPFPGWVALFPCLGTVLCLAADHQAGHHLTLVGRFLSLAPMVFIGKISYSLYLWHWPVHVFFRHVKLEELTRTEQLMQWVLSFGLATVSWWWVEQPVRSRSLLKFSRTLLMVTGLGVAAMVGIGLWFSKTDGLPNRIPDAIYELTRDSTEIKYYRTRSRDSYLQNSALPTVGSAEDEAARHILVWGDSHLSAILPVLDELGRENRVCVHVAAQPSTPPLLDTYNERIGKASLSWGDTVLQYAGEKGITKVLLHSRWQMYTEGPPDGDMRNLVSNARIHSRSPAQAEKVFRESFSETLAAMEKEGWEVYFLDDVPFHPRSVPEAVILSASRGKDPNLLGPSKEEQGVLTAKIDKLVGELVAGKAVQRLDPDPYLLDEGTGRYALLGEGKILYTDQHHLSPTGSRRLRELLEGLFE